jgi:hypothetical protein
MNASKPEKVKFKRYTHKQLTAYAKANPATSDFAFGERSGGYIVTVPSKSTVPMVSVSCKEQRGA